MEQEMFGKLYEDIMNYDAKNPVLFDYAEAYSAFEPSERILKKMFDVCSHESDDIVKSFIEANYETVFTIFETGSNADKETVGMLLALPRFLVTLAKVLSSKKQLSNSDVQRMSNLYINCIQSYNELTNLYPAYRALAKIVNMRLITMLSDIVSEDAAILIAASSNVSYNHNLCVLNANYAIDCVANHEHLSDIQIEKIYDILIDNNFDNMKSYFVYTFISTQCYSGLLGVIRLLSIICDIAEKLPMYQINILVNSLYMEYIRIVNTGVTDTIPGADCTQIDSMSLYPIINNPEFANKFKRLYSSFYYTNAKMNQGF